ncbi:MAG TPA: hypothetical protein VN512_02750 [Clostridia bacterium]|nr:hypothetical protein [Clostridia bacterium]
MKKYMLRTLLTHATIVLSVVFLVFFCIDRFNPAMEFIGSDISDWLLCAFCVIALLSSILSAVQLYKKGE